MNAEEDYADARLKVARARARAIETSQEIKARLAPQTLAHNAWEKVRVTGEELADRSAETARAHPIATTAAGTAAAALILRRPIWRVVKRLFGRSKRGANTD